MRVDNFWLPQCDVDVFTTIFMSNQSAVGVDIMLWLSWGCDNENELIQLFRRWVLTLKQLFLVLSNCIKSHRVMNDYLRLSFQFYKDNKHLARAAALQSVAVRRLTGNDVVATFLFFLGKY